MSNTQPLINDQQKQQYNNQMGFNPQMQNQQMGFNPQMQNQQMVNGNMPPQGIYMTLQNQFTQQEEQLLQQQGIQRLQSMNECYVQQTMEGGCSDLVLCRAFAQEIEVKLDPSTQKPLFKIRFEKLGCLQQNVKGNIYSMNHNNPGYVQEEEIYSIKRVRKNCFLKGICCILWPISCCIFCASNSTGTLYGQDGQQISQSTFASLCSKEHTVDIQNSNSYTISNPQQTQQSVVSMERQYSVLKHGNLTDIQVVLKMGIAGVSDNGGIMYSCQGKKINFGQGNLTVQEKISIIFLASQIMI